MAKGVLTSLKPKYNMTTLDPDDGLTLTNRRQAANEREHVNIRHGSKVVFDPSVTTKDMLAECFRAFVGDAKPEETLVIQEQRGISLDKEHVTVYTDGLCSNNGKENAKCRSGV
jgi:hypothetical protein